ncbi:hypothetical protein IC617_17560 [Neiella sp. HB171785]|uniref:Uncharacterized protein n=1 Tax=Neiella litorisoli TaxID=2771431 RepID=A0A8J6QVD3_9GAMM|nr:hypothetical protein [Neiella litorisoli]MBD1391237.1 hypothetical protein [Neiella litorisoli]
MTAFSGRLLAASLFIATLASCSSSPEDNGYDIESQLVIDQQSSPVSFNYQALITPHQSDPDESRSRSIYDRILPPEEPYQLSEPSNAKVLREHQALNDLEHQLQQRASCPRSYEIDKLTHNGRQVVIVGHCLPR